MLVSPFLCHCHQLISHLLQSAVLAAWHNTVTDDQAACTHGWGLSGHQASGPAFGPAYPFVKGHRARLARVRIATRLAATVCKAWSIRKRPQVSAYKQRTQPLTFRGGPASFGLLLQAGCPDGSGLPP
eukprot:scaffold42215_cov15-Tisochrysis_lutea.AAC.1